MSPCQPFPNRHAPSPAKRLEPGALAHPKPLTAGHTHRPAAALHLLVGLALATSACLGETSPADPQGPDTFVLDTRSPDTLGTTEPEVTTTPDVEVTSTPDNDVTTALDVERVTPDVTITNADVTLERGLPSAMNAVACAGWRVVGPTADLFWGGATWASSADDMWVAAGDYLWHWDGTTLDATPIGCDVRPTALWGSGSELWIGTATGAVWHRAVTGTWTRHVVAEGVRLNAVRGTGPDAVWAVGKGLVARWDGQAWTTENLVDGAGLAPTLEGVWADADGVWLVGTTRAEGTMFGPGTVYQRTTDGTDRWQRVHTTPADLRAIWRTDDGVLLVAGRTPAGGTNGLRPSPILRLDGTTWSAVPAPPVNTVGGIAARTLDDLWLYGQGNTVWHFDGQQWTEVASPFSVQGGPGGTTGAPRGFAAESLWPLGGGQATLWAGGNPMIATAEAGTARTQARALRVGCCHLVAATGTGPDDVWLVGERAFVLHWDGQRYTFDETLARQQSAPDAWPFPRLSAAWVAPDGAVWTVGSQGQVWRRPVGGAWVDMHAPTDALLTGIWGAGDTVWVVGLHGAEEFDPATGVLLAWDGLQWRAPLKGLLPGLRAITGSGPDDVWAVGRGPDAFHFDGSAWTPVALGVDANLSSVVSQGPGRVRAGGTYDQYSSATYAGLIVDLGVDAVDVLRTARNEPVLSLWQGGALGIAFDSVPRAWTLADGMWRPGPRLDDFATSPQNHIWSDGQRLWVAARDGYVYLSPPFEALYESLRGASR